MKSKVFRGKEKGNKKGYTTLALLNVAVGVFRPRLGNADIRVQFLHATVEIDAS